MPEVLIASGSAPLWNKLTETCLLSRFYAHALKSQRWKLRPLTNDPRASSDPPNFVFVPTPHCVTHQHTQLAHRLRTAHKPRTATSSSTKLPPPQHKTTTTTTATTNHRRRTHQQHSTARHGTARAQSTAEPLQRPRARRRAERA